MASKAVLDHVRTKAFVQGYVTAAVTLICLHDQPGMAQDVLNQLGYCDRRWIDSYDKRILRGAKVKLPSRRNG